MLLAEQWQCSLYANVLFVQSSVPTMFLHFFANGRVTNRRVPPFPKLGKHIKTQNLLAAGDANSSSLGGVPRLRLPFKTY